MPTNAGPAHRRDELVHEHMGQVRALASQVRERFRLPFDLDELVAYGVQGLLEAADRYDSASGAAFFTFAFYRVRGAMFDGIRQMGWLNRREYARHRQEMAAMSAADQYLEGLAQEEAESAGQALGPDDGANSPSCDDTTVEQTLEEVSQALAGVAAIFVTSLEAADVEPVAAVDETCAERQLLAHERRVRVRSALDALPDKERRLLEQYYLQGRTLDEAGASLGLSKSWASRLHTRAVGLLRAQLEAEEAPASRDCDTPMRRAFG